MKLKVLLFLCGIFAFNAGAASLSIRLHATRAEGRGPIIGDILVKETRYGLLFIPNLRGLIPGIYRFQLYSIANCEAALSDVGQVPDVAMRHYADPTPRGTAFGSYHLAAPVGDLPSLVVHENGTSNSPVLVPRLTSLKQIKARSVILHAEENLPVRHARSGAEMACGVVGG